MKKILSILWVGTMVLSMTACGSSSSTADVPAATDNTAQTEEAAPEASASDEEVTLTFWSWLPTTEQSEKMIADFEAENLTIKIDYTRTEQDDYFEKLQVAMASGTGPDLFGLTTGTMTDQYTPFTADMSELANTYWSGWDELISKNAVEQCVSSEGKTVGMPLLVAGMTDLLYNKTLMDECGIDKVPTTYAELKDAADKAKANGYVGVAVGAADDWINSDVFVQISNEFEEGCLFCFAQCQRRFFRKIVSFIIFILASG